jgi:hypothetical protein
LSPVRRWTPGFLEKSDIAKATIRLVGILLISIKMAGSILAPA